MIRLDSFEIANPNFGSLATIEGDAEGCVVPMERDDRTNRIIKSGLASCRNKFKLTDAHPTCPRYFPGKRASSIGAHVYVSGLEAGGAVLNGIAARKTCL